MKTDQCCGVLALVKPCLTCGRVLPSTAFAKNRSKKDGLQGVCRTCDSARAVARQAAKPLSERTLVTRARKVQNSGVLKTCLRCEQEKPIEAFGEYTNKRGIRTTRGACSVCWARADRERKAGTYVYTPPPSKQVPPGTKRCTCCKQVLAIDCFGTSNGSLNSRCRPCAVEVATAWIVNNREKHRDAARQRRRSNPTFWREQAMARYAGRNTATPVWADRKAIREFYKACPAGYHVDHIVPLRGKTVCGLHVLWNLQYLPARENRRKLNKLIEEDAHGKAA
jgi:hypothetical protein